MVSNLISVRQDAQNPTRSRSDNVGKTPKPLVFEKRMSCFSFPNSSPFGKMTDLPITPSPKFSRTVRLELPTRRSRPGARYHISSRRPFLRYQRAIRPLSSRKPWDFSRVPLAVAKCQQRQFCEQVVVNGSRVASSVLAKNTHNGKLATTTAADPTISSKKHVYLNYIRVS